MFETLTKGFRTAKQKFQGLAELDEATVDDALKEVRTALLEADVEADVGFQQRRSHLLERVVDGRLVELRQPLEFLLGGAEPLGQCLEHEGRNLACLPPLSQAALPISLP